MTAPTLCVIFEATGPYNAIGKVAMAQVEAALAAGWRVSVVAKRLDESLHGRVEWLKLYVPPRGFALKWLTGRHFIQRALGDRRFDVIHGHQPQIADLCDLFQCHFLTRAAYEACCLEDKHGARRAAEWLQNRVVLLAEDRYYGNWNPRTRMLFNSELTRRSFCRFYPRPPEEEVFLLPAPELSPIDAQERKRARRKFLGGEDPRLVVGFLGGLHERKGFRRVVQSLEGQRDIFLLIGGMYSDGYLAPGLEGHSRGVGVVETPEFYAACDLLVVASHFEPFGLVALEAAARGLPVIATPEVGALPHLLEAGAGLAWTPGKNQLADLVRQAARERAVLGSAGLRWAEMVSPARHAHSLLALYDTILAKKSARSANDCTVPNPA